MSFTLVTTPTPLSGEQGVSTGSSVPGLFSALDSQGIVTGLLADLAIAIALGTIIFWAVEAEKSMAGRKRSRQGVHSELLVR